jgi:hypothetical protein
MRYPSLHAMTILQRYYLVVPIFLYEHLKCFIYPKMSAVASKRTIFDIPRLKQWGSMPCHPFIKEIPESEVCITSPATLGAEIREYLAINPQGEREDASSDLLETGMNLAGAIFYLSLSLVQNTKIKARRSKSTTRSRISLPHSRHVRTTIQGTPPHLA